MASSKNQPIRPAPSIATAAAKARSAIQDLQAKLTEASHLTAAPPVENQEDERPESEDDLERQLEAYFARASRSPRSVPAGPVSRTPILDALRSQVIDGVVDRILDEWARGHSDAEARGLGDEVMERLIERVLQQVRTVPELSKTALSA